MNENCYIYMYRDKINQTEHFNMKILAIMTKYDKSNK